MSEFLNAVQVGANVMNMRRERQERMMQLRAQAAMQALQERQISENVSLLIQRTKEIEQDTKIKEDQVRRRQSAATAVGELFEANKKKFGDPIEALGATVAPVALLDEDMGAQLALTYQRLASGKNEGKPRPLDPTQIALNQARTDAIKQGKDKSVPAAVATLEYRKELKQKINDAEESGNWDEADDLKDDLATLDRTHPDIREKARYQAIVSSLRQVEKNLADLTLKSKWPELEKQKVRLQKQLEGGPSEVQPSGSTVKRFQWTPEGMKEK